MDRSEISDHSKQLDPMGAGFFDVAAGVLNP
jgi:hypothetical protein